MCNPERAMPQLKTVKDIKVAEITNDSIKINLIAVVQNNLNSSIQIEKLNLNILSSNDTIGYAFTLNEVELKPDTNNIPMSVCLSNNKLTKVISGAKNDSLLLTIKGNVKSKVSIFRPNSEINSQVHLSIKKDLFEPFIQSTKADDLIGVRKIKIKDIGLTSTKIIVDFAVKNPFDFEIELLSFPSDIYLYNKKVGNGDLLNNPVKVQKKGKITTGQFLFNANNFMSVGAGLSTIFSGGIVEYTIDGIIHLGLFNNDFPVPFTKKGKINIRE
jgi:LEA14-like dessication related protein